MTVDFKKGKLRSTWIDNSSKESHKMKKGLGQALGIFLLLFAFQFKMEQAYAEMNYDFNEVDMATGEVKSLGFENQMTENIPNYLEAKNPIQIMSRGLNGVYGEESRKKVENTSIFPYSAVGRVVSSSSVAGVSSVGSGVLINENTVLTCAHAVTDGKGNYSKTVSFAPGYTPENSPFGVAKVTKIYVMANYHSGEDSESDIAVLKLDRPIGRQAGWFGLSYLDNKQDTFGLTGYPVLFNDKSMYTETSKIPEGFLNYANTWEKDLIRTTFDVTSGNSGSPLYDSQYRVSGVAVAHMMDNNSQETMYTIASRISLEKYAMIYQLLQKDGYQAVEEIKIIPESLTIAKGEQKTLQAEILPETATNKNVVWSSSDEIIASVDENGKIYARRAGKVRITVESEDGEKTATCLVTVVPTRIAVASVSLDIKTASLGIGKTQQLNATISPENATNKQVSWSSSNEKIATVDSTGLVTAKGIGKASITVLTEDGEKVDTAVVTVSEKGEDDYPNKQEEATLIETDKEYHATFEYKQDSDWVQINNDKKQLIVMESSNQARRYYGSNDGVNWNWSKSEFGKIQLDGKYYETLPSYYMYHRIEFYSAVEGDCTFTFKTGKMTAPTIENREDINNKFFEVGDMLQLNGLARNGINEKAFSYQVVGAATSIDETGKIILNSPGYIGLNIIDKFNRQYEYLRFYVGDDYPNKLEEAALVETDKEYKVSFDYKDDSDWVQVNNENQPVMVIESDKQVKSYSGSYDGVTWSHPTTNLGKTVIDGKYYEKLPNHYKYHRFEFYSATEGDCSFTVKTGEMTAPTIENREDINNKIFKVGDTLQLNGLAKNGIDTKAFSYQIVGSAASIDGNGKISLNGPGHIGLNIIDKFNGQREYLSFYVEE